MATKPAMKMKRGRVAASIWANQGREGDVFYGVTFQRTYRGTEGKLVNTTNFTAGDLGDLVLLAIEADQWTRRAQDADRSDDGPEEPTDL
jgi:hypothetical protein